MRYEQAFAITERLDQLLVLVGRGCHPSYAIAEQLGVSEQTVYRDIVFLKKRGHPIRAVRLANNWAYQLTEDQEQHQQRDAARRA
jgi:DeoR/GlpR family transcriptional regulator of sugar metabolism